MLDLNRIFELWLKCTGKDVSDFDKIRIGVESDWLCNKAKEMLKKDDTGLLAGITMRAAYRKFIKEHHIDLAELIDGEWDRIRNDWLDLKYELYESNVGEIVNNTINDMVLTINKFGRKVTREEVEAQDIETVFVDAFDKFRIFVKDTFRAPSSYIPVNPRIINKLYKFDHYKQFIDSLRNETEDNFIVVALIDRTFEDDDSEYGKNCDKFFAFGCKYNGGITVISDRVDVKSMGGKYGTRNPYRDIDNKIDYSHLPYHRLKQIKEVTENNNQLLLPEPNVEKHEEFCEAFDLEGYIYITAIISIIVNNYFKNNNWDTNIKLFGSEVKYLTAAESKALVVRDANMITLPENNTKAEEYTGEEDAYNNGLFDFFIEEHPINALIPINDHFIGTTAEIEARAWWNVRNAQKEQIEKDLEESYHNQHRRAEIDTFIRSRMIDYVEDLIEYAFTHEDNKPFDKYTHTCGFEGKAKEGEPPTIWETYKDQKEFDSLQVESVFYKSQRYWMSKPRRYWYDSYNINHIRIEEYNWGGIQVWFDDDNDNRGVEVVITFRTYSDLVKHLGFDNVDDLPEELRHYIYTRASSFTGVGWKPNTGNSLLNFTDPMNEIEDPWRDHCFKVYMYMSRSYYKKLVKKYGNKKTQELRVEDEKW